MGCHPGSMDDSGHSQGQSTIRPMKYAAIFLAAAMLYLVLLRLGGVQTAMAQLDHALLTFMRAVGLA